MNTTKKLLCGIALAGITVAPVMAGAPGGHGHHGHDGGVHLAAEIIALVRDVLTPTPAHHTPPPPPPKHHRDHHHRDARPETHRPAPHGAPRAHR